MADQGDSAQEKTEEASARKIEKAREEGQVPRSRDLTTTFVLLLAMCVIWMTAEFIGRKILGLTTQNFVLTRAQIFDVNTMIANLVDAVYQGLASIAPMMIALVIASIVGPIALGGWNYTGKAVAPKMSRIDPLAGLKRIFSIKSLIELAKSIFKVALLMLATFALLKYYAQPIFRINDADVEVAIIHSLDISLVATLILAAVTIAIALVDVPLQIFEYKKNLKMSRQDQKDEYKETEGKPEVKGRIRQLQREMSQRRMMANVPEADVIITNPTHFAVALKYDPDTMETPILLAKGIDHTALKIREIAKAHKIEILESPALARSIYYTSEIDESVPEGLYMAVAQVLAYVYQLRNYRKGQGPRPAYPRRPPIPKDMQYD